MRFMFVTFHNKLAWTLENITFEKGTSNISCQNEIVIGSISTEVFFFT